MSGARANHNGAVRGVCPGVAAPMASGDGLLLRLRHPIGGWTPAQVGAVAQVAEEHGNRALELTVRGNLQLRGVRPATLMGAQTALVAAGVADSDPDREAVRNVLSAPATDLDPDAVADITPVARAVADAIAADTALHRLPAKTGVVVDGGGAAGIAGVHADLRLDAVTCDHGGVRYLLSIGGRAADAVPLGRVAPEQAAVAARRVLARLLDDNPPRRMAAALAERGAAPFQDALAELAEPAGTVPVPAVGPPAPGVAPHGVWVHAAFPFGALNAAQLRQLAVVAELHAAASGTPTLRLTPWRSVLLAGVSAAALEPLAALGAITEPADARLGLGACVGAPGCASGTTATRNDALALEAAMPTLLAAGERLHVSGCGKGCGAPVRAAAMLVADGERYALTLSGGVGAMPDWPAMPLAGVHRRLMALDAVYAGERRTPRESLNDVINRLGRNDVVRRVEEESSHA
ncbi:precorrin-3B synthase [Aquisalimonas sp.]|uniref:precorrin-3B synthase n=1 Tax=unclassified Aquisalimonas TaxID=2644645 RepID=UPI0025BEDFCE|nr:precorrin-3B synthase [Aquisalimonas sp.]